MKYIFWLLILFVFAFNSSISAFPLNDPTYISRWAGAFCYAVETDSEYIFMSKGGYADIFNKQDYDSLGRIEVPGYILEMKSKDGYLYVATDKYGIFIFDITSISSPLQVGNYKTDSYINTFRIREQYLYCASVRGLLIIDISDPREPALAAKYYDGCMVLDLEFKDNLIYITQYGSSYGVHILDITDPINPVLIKKVVTSFAACESIAIFNDILFVSSSDFGVLQSYSLKEPANPKQISHMGNYWAEKMYIEREKLFLLSGGNSIAVFDVSDPDTIAYLAEYNMNADSKRIRFYNNLLFAAEGYNGLSVYNIENILQPELVKNIISPGSTEDVLVEGNYAYLANHGLWIIDVSDPKHPKEIGSINMLRTIEHIIKYDTLVFLAENNKIHIVSVKDVTKPWKVSEIRTSVINSFRFAKPYLYVASHDKIIIWDISDAHNPMPFNSIPISDPCADIRIKNNYLFTSQPSDGITVYNISNPRNPVKISSLLIHSVKIDITNNVLVTNYGNDFSVVDISDINNMKFKYTVTTEAHITNLFISDDLLYIFPTGGDVQIFSIPHCTFMASYNDNSFHLSGCLSNNYLFVAEAYGMVILKVENITSVKESPGVINEFNLKQNYPNPFNPTTTINYSLAKDGDVTLSIYDALGSKVEEIVNEYKPAGNYTVQFNGSKLASGVYLYRLQSGNYTDTRKLVIMK